MAISFVMHTFCTMPGYLTASIALDCIIFLKLLYLAHVMVIPALSSFWRGKRLDKIAGTSKKHWFFGHTKEYPINQKGMTNTLRRMLSFPIMCSHWVGPFFSMLLVSHSDTAVALLNSKAPKDNFSYKFLRPWIGDGLLMSKGEKWQRNRRLLTSTFHFSILKGYTKVFNETAKTMLKKWKKMLGQPIEVFSDVSLMTLDSMLRCAMSTETDCQHASSKHPYIKAVRDLTDLIVVRFDKPYLLWDFLYWLFGYAKLFQQATDIVHSHAENVIRERRSQLEKTQKSKSKKIAEHDDEHFIPTRRKYFDFLDILLQTRDEYGNGLTEKEIRDEVDTFLFEGHDTTASGISWALYNLAKYPDLQNKCREEVNFVLKTRELVEWNDLSSFNYLAMFIKESMRLYPPVPTIARELDEPLKIQSSLNDPTSCVIPRKTSISLMIFAVHQNQHLWDNPEKFDPERFTKENIAKRSSFAYIPFSAGSRNCIGQSFAMNEMKTVLAQVLRKCRLFLDEETPVPEMQPRLIMQSANGIHIKLEYLR